MASQSPAPLVSVIIPVYNVEAYLERCVRSVLDQSYSHLEILLIDDGSTDNSSSLCDSLALTDSRIIVFHKENGGLSSARNMGLEAANGDYLVYVDSDDLIGSEHIFNLLSAAVGLKADMAITGCTHIPDMDSLVITSKIEPSDYRLFNPVDAACEALSQPDALFREYACGKIYSSAIKPHLYFPEGKLFEDQFVMYKAMLASNMIVYENANDYYYTIRHASITNQRNRRHLDTLEARQAIIEHAKNNDIPQLKDAAVNVYYGNLIGEFAGFCLSNDAETSDLLHHLIIENRMRAITSSTISRSTRYAFLLSFLPKRLFASIMRYIERKGKEQDIVTSKKAIEQLESTIL